MDICTLPIRCLRNVTFFIPSCKWEIVKIKKHQVIDGIDIDGNKWGIQLKSMLLNVTNDMFTLDISSKDKITTPLSISEQDVPYYLLLHDYLELFSNLDFKVNCFRFNNKRYIAVVRDKRIVLVEDNKTNNEIKRIASYHAVRYVNGSLPLTIFSNQTLYPITKFTIKKQTINVEVFDSWKTN